MNRQSVLSVKSVSVKMLVQMFLSCNQQHRTRESVCPSGVWYFSRFLTGRDVNMPKMKLKKPAMCFLGPFYKYKEERNKLKFPKIGGSALVGRVQSRDPSQPIIIQNLYFPKSSIPFALKRSAI